jgi:hypothetical protein
MELKSLVAMLTEALKLPMVQSDDDEDDDEDEGEDEGVDGVTGQFPRVIYTYMCVCMYSCVRLIIIN